MGNTILYVQIISIFTLNQNKEKPPSRSEDLMLFNQFDGFFQGMTRGILTGFYTQ